MEDEWDKPLMEALDLNPVRLAGPYLLVLILLMMNFCSIFAVLLYIQVCRFTTKNLRNIICFFLCMMSQHIQQHHEYITQQKVNIFEKQLFLSIMPHILPVEII
jgi:hypothetical protein